MASPVNATAIWNMNGGTTGLLMMTAIASPFKNAAASISSKTIATATGSSATGTATAESDGVRLKTMAWKNVLSFPVGAGLAKFF